MMFRPAWNDAVAMCKKTAVNVAECEYADMKRLPSSMQKVMGFPTVMVYEDSKPVAAFNGPRTAEDVASFFQSYEGKPAAKPSIKKTSVKKATKVTSKKATTPKKAPTKGKANK